MFETELRQRLTRLVSDEPGLSINDIADAARVSRRRNLGVQALGIVAAAVAIAGGLVALSDGSRRASVVSEDPSPSIVQGTLPLDTHPTGNASNAAAIGGVFAANSGHDGVGCAWIEHDGYRTYIRWPEGFRLRASDLALIRPNGEVAAQVGDRIGGGGGISGVSANGADALPGCNYHGVVWNLTLGTSH